MKHGFWFTTQCRGARATYTTTTQHLCIISLHYQQTAAVIFLHGLGDNGDGWSFLEKQFARSMPYVDWEFPTAPTMPVTIAGGRAMNAWYDLWVTDSLFLSEEWRKHGMAICCH